MPNTTMAFDEETGGWTSEFTFLPDSGLSLNNKYYTFKNGRVYEHNSSNVARNEFYGIAGSTIIQFVFNDNPTIIKNYKSLNFEGIGQWDTTLQTNVEQGEILGTSYILKEGESYGWVRGNQNLLENLDLTASAVAGIGQVDSITNVSSPTPQVDTYSFTKPIPDGISVNDIIYRVEGTNAPQLVGVVESKDTNSITTTTNGLGGTAMPVTAVAGDLLIYVKDNRVEKSGIIGYYNVVTMTNASAEMVELFSVNANTYTVTRE